MKTKRKINKVKRKPPEWEATFASLTSERGFITRLCKELKRQKVKETTHFFFKKK